MKVGIMGGTFDPVHSGHLIIAEEVREALGLGEVLFMPCGQPWLKLERPITPAVHRVEMVRLAIGTAPQFKLSEVEVSAPVLHIPWTPWSSSTSSWEPGRSCFSSLAATPWLI